MLNILVVDDERIQRKNISDFLSDAGYSVKSAEGVKKAIELMDKTSFDVVISDMKMNDGSGRDILDHLNKGQGKVYFLLVTAFANVEDSVYIMKNGGYDYIQKPVNLHDLENKMRNIESIILIEEENQMLRSSAKEVKEGIVIKSHGMENVLKTVEQVASAKASVLIQGESGTGKEVIARLLHEKSGRRENMFVAVNCGALNENLLESELFGYEKGAFTGASARKKGRFEIADKGTVFLDEIGDISLNMQVKLLRVLQEGEFERVGGVDTIKTDTRIIAATNKDIDELIRKGAFREDLYFRLNVITIKIPPLRERREEIIPLAEMFVKQYAEENRKSVRALTKDAADVLMSYSFPGNVRELQNIIQRAVILTSGDRIEGGDIMIRNAPIPDNDSETMDMNKAVERLESGMIRRALKENGGSIQKSAKSLNITERMLRYKMEKMSIEKDNFR